MKLKDKQNAVLINVLVIENVGKMKHSNFDSRKNENPYRGMVVEVRNNVDKAMRILKKKLQDIRIKTAPQKPVQKAQ